MRRIHGAAIVALLALSGPSWAETVRTTSRLNLRQEPTTSSPRIELLPVGLELEVITRRGLWIRVDKDGTEGWVHSDYVVPTALDPAVGARPDDPNRVARDAELARDVALLRVGKLEREVEALRAAAPDAARHNVTLRARVEELAAQLEERDARLAALEEELAVGDSGSLSTGDSEGAESEPPALDTVESGRHAERVRELETELESARAAAGQQRDEIAELQRQLADGDSAAAVLEARNAELETSNANREELAQRVSSLEAALTAAHEESAVQATDLATAQRQLAESVETATRLEAAEAALAAAEARRDALARQTEQLTAELTDARAAIAGRDDSLRALEERLASATGAGSALEQSVADLASMTEERDALAAELARVEVSAETEGVERGQLEARYEALAEERDLLTRDASTREVRISDLEELLRERDADLVSLRAAEESTRGAAAESDDRVRELAADRDQITAELAAERAALTVAGEELKERDDALAAERSRSRAAATAAEVERGRLEASLAAIEEERDLLTRSATAQERRISELSETLRERETELASLRVALEESRESALADDAPQRELAADRDRLAAELAAQKAALTTAGEQLKDGSAELAAERARSREAKEAAEVERERLEASLATVVEERDQLERSSAAQERRISELREALSEREAALDAGGVERDEELREARRALEVANEEKDRLAKTAQEYETEGRRYADALMELQAWSDQAEDEIARLGALNAELTAAVDDLKGKAARRQEPLRRELEETRARVKAAEERLADAERETSRLREELAVSGSVDARLAVAESARSEVEEALRVARAELGAATVARERSEAEARELMDQLASAAARQAVLARRVTELEQTSQVGDTDLAGQVAELTEERDRLARSLSRSLSAAEATAGEAATWRAAADRRAAELDAVRQQLAAATDQLEALRAERSTTAARVPVVAPAEPLSVASRPGEDPRAADGTGQGTSEPAPESPLVTVAEPIVAPVAAPEAEGPDPRAGAIAAVRSWAGSWSRQDVDGYLASYGASFEPSDGLDRGAWEEQRRVRLRRPSFIEVEVSNLETRVLSADRIAVRFRQDYRSDNYADRVLKTLELERIDGDWKIVSEVAE